MDAMIQDTSPIFAGLTVQEREAILSGAIPHVLKARDVLAREGEPAEAFHVVQLGHLKLTRVSADGSEIVMRFVGPGGPFAGIVAGSLLITPLAVLAQQTTKVSHRVPATHIARTDRHCGAPTRAA